MTLMISILNGELWLHKNIIFQFTLLLHKIFLTSKVHSWIINNVSHCLLFGHSFYSRNEGKDKRGSVVLITIK